MGNQMTDEKISKQARAEALKIARGIQRPGQKKEQTDNGSFLQLIPEPCESLINQSTC